METIASQFAEYAERDLTLWSEMTDSVVNHVDYGIGKIVNVELREKYIPILEIQFNTSYGIKLFNTHAFRGDNFSHLDIPESLSQSFNDWFTCKQKHEKEKSELQPLADKHGVPIEKLIDSKGATELVEILQKLEDKKNLSLNDIKYLKGSNAYNVVAAHYYRCFNDSEDIWDLVRTCSNLRRAGFTKTAIRLATIDSKSSRLPDKKAYAALYTTKGGVYRDINELENAIQCGLQAIEISPDSHHPYNLLGAVNYELGEYENGQKYFDKAIELGSSSYLQDAEIKAALSKTSQDERRKLQEYLLERNPERFSWVKKLL